MIAKPDAPAARRNRAAILEVLHDEFADRRRVLEIGSGTGQHAVYFAAALPHLEWQTSDRPDYLPGIQSWIDDAASDNLPRPIELDVDDDEVSIGEYDAVFSANTAHIMSASSVENMIRLVGHVLPSDGVFCLYGPFNVGGEFTSESNARFHESLQQQDPAMGIRDLETLQSSAAKVGLTLSRRYAMPSNNQLLVWRKA
jgi:cyclopropane fatty-acyl-phospholipid synthase-like methyltransferase